MTGARADSPSDGPGPAVPEWFRDAHAALPRPDRRDPGEDVPWSMPVILDIPKSPRPDRTELLEAAATAVVACCLDRRAAVGGEFADGLRSWYGARIRKIARRARNIQWERAGRVPGVTASVGGASARALVPGPVGSEPAAVAKLQIGGTELPHSDRPAATDADVPVIWVDDDLGMTVGKCAAQVGHGSMLLAAVLAPERAWEWARAGFPLQVREVPRDRLPDAGDPAVAVVVHDAGFTEIAPGSATVTVTGGRYLRGD